jgi:hypothetical protein
MYASREVYSLALIVHYMNFEIEYREKNYKKGKELFFFNVM